MELIREILNKKIKNFETWGAWGNLTIRPHRKKTRLYIDNEYLEEGYADFLSKQTTMVYLVLAKYANYRTQTCFPSISTIMCKSGVRNRNSVVKALKTLKQYHIIAISHSKGRTSNCYALLHTSVWKNPNNFSANKI